MTPDEAKKLAAKAAVDELPSEGVIGLGSGSTAKLFIEEVGRLVAAGRKLSGVATSVESYEQAKALGIPMLDDMGPWDVLVTVDGADEVDEELNLIKGGGAAHTREKIVNFSSRRNVIIVDGTKLSKRLGEKWPVPVEVLPFGHLCTKSALSTLGRPVLRMRDGAPVRTDAGNLVYDVHTGPIDRPAEVDRLMDGIPGVVETGLFVARADVVLVADASGIRRLSRPS